MIIDSLLPGILEKDETSIEKKLARVKGIATHIHIDLLDGVFAPNTSFLTPSFFKQYEGEFFFELHMMVDDPRKYLAEWAKAGIKRFIGHVEMMPDQTAFLHEAKQFGEAYLGIDAPTTVEKVAVPYREVDGFLVMTVKAGFSGQVFMPQMLKKVETLRKRTTAPIEVDGGINDKTLVTSLKSGANHFVATSFLFGSDNLLERYNNLSKIITGGMEEK